MVNQLRVDNIGQRFFMTAGPEESEKRRDGTQPGEMLEHVCIHEIFSATGVIFTSSCARRTDARRSPGFRGIFKTRMHVAFRIR